MEGKEDLRVVKTRANIQAKFVQLLREKGFQRVTVQDILDAALINRTTFYRHYDSKYDLADRMAGDFLERFAMALETARGDRTTGLAAMYAMLVEDRERTLALWDLRTDGTDVRARMERMLQEAYPALVGDDSLPADGFQPRVFSAIALTAFRYVLEGGEGHSMDDVRAGMRGYLQASGRVLAAFE
ncbi:MAG: TetR/AcrR family transcriptional regulator [Eggerthellaceae bacterium]|jgi:AcrR family transcriptional regulator|nr:TetR/AcrR family transcriptional regulator [Eggerthellaceae bacterium]